MTLCRALSGWLLAELLACGATPGPPPAISVAKSEPCEVPLRDTSGESVPLRASARDRGEEHAMPAERWSARTIERAPPPKARGRLIDLDVKAADIHDVCRLLAEVGGVNIVVADDVHGMVTVRMKQVPWDQALDAIAETKGLSVTFAGDVVMVKPAGK